MSEQEDHLKKLAETATRADFDTEEKILDLHDMVLKRRKDPELEKRYEARRDELVAQLESEGPRYFIDAHGNKRYAYAVVPEPVDVDLDELLVEKAKGNISEETFEAVAPRKIDKEQFRRHVSNGNIPKDVFRRVAKVSRGTPHVGFSDPVE